MTSWNAFSRSALLYALGLRQRAIVHARSKEDTISTIARTVCTIIDKSPVTNIDQCPTAGLEGRLGGGGRRDLSESQGMSSHATFALTKSRNYEEFKSTSSSILPLFLVIASLRCIATIHWQANAGDPSCLATGKENSRPGYVVRDPDAMQRVK